MDEDLYYTSICSAATLQSDKKGFFQNYADNVLEEAGALWLDEFRECKSDTERLLKCYNEERIIEEVHGVLNNVQQLYRSKSARLSLQRRLEGEKATKEGKLERALLLLDQSVVRAPGPGVDCSVDDGLSLPLSLWSRANTLWKMSEYQLCLADLQLSLKEKLPEHYRVEAYWQMAQCYRSLGEVVRARVALQVTLKILNSEDTTWRDRIEAELTNLQNLENKEHAESKDDVELLDGPNKHLPGLSSVLSVRSSQKTGRYIVANQPISSGDVLAVEAPYVACLLPDKFGSHCHHCFNRLRSAVSCMQCAGVAFCSAACRDSAHIYHQHECRYMELMIGSGMSILCYVALRTITQQKYSYWKKVQAKQPVTPDYNKLAILVTHANQRQPRDFVGRTLMALFLLKILEHSKYIPLSDCKDDSLSGMPLFLGCILLHLLQCLQFNCHEIYETIYKSELNFTSSKINYVGVGVYPSVALMNHDCYPATQRYFRGKELVLRAVRPIKSGEAVPENYGPVFTQRSLLDRKRLLGSRYWFNCDCKACQENWPKLDDIDDSIINIRCQSKDCNGYIAAPKELKKSRVKCPKCSVNVNVEEGVLLVKSYNKDFDLGFELMGKGELCKAAGVLAAYSDAMHAKCHPPVKNICLAQEAMRSCWAYSYNKHILQKPH